MREFNLTVFTMNFEGNLNSLFLPNVLQLLNKEATKGVLRIFRTGRDLVVYMEDGEVVYADGVDKEVQLLNLMRRRKVISEAVLLKLQEVTESDPYALGPFLLNNKLISPEAWQKFLKLKVEQVLLEAILSENSDFRFSAEEYSLPPEYKTQINLMQLILDITRKIDELNFIRKHIPDRNIIFQVCEDLSGESKSINFNRTEWVVLSKIDGKRTVDEIIAQCDMEELQVLKILYSFLSSGLIKRLEGVYLNWKGNFVDYEGIISLYLDLFKILEKNLQKEIGKEFFRIYKRTLEIQEKNGIKILVDFDPFSERRELNLQLIIKRLAKYHDFNEGKRELLVAFNGAIRTVAYEIKSIVGRQLIEKTLNEIYAAISFVGKYQQQYSDINTLVLDTLKESLAEK